MYVVPTDQRKVKSPGAGDTGGPKLPSVGAGKLNFGPLEEQQMLSHLSSPLDTFCKQGRKDAQEWPVAEGASCLQASMFYTETHVER